MVKNEHSGASWVLHCVAEEERISGNYTLSTTNVIWLLPSCSHSEAKSPKLHAKSEHSVPSRPWVTLVCCCGLFGAAFLPTGPAPCQAKALSALWRYQVPSRSCGSAHALACPEVPFSLSSCYTFTPHTWPSHMSSPPRSFPNRSPPQEERLCCSFFYLGA